MGIFEVILCIYRKQGILWIDLACNNPHVLCYYFNCLLEKDRLIVRQKRVNCARTLLVFVPLMNVKNDLKVTALTCVPHMQGGASCFLPTFSWCGGFSFNRQKFAHRLYRFPTAPS